MWDEKFGREVVFGLFQLRDIGYGDFVQFVTSVLPGLNEELWSNYIRACPRGALPARRLGHRAARPDAGGARDADDAGEHLRTAPRIYCSFGTSASGRSP